MSSSLSRLIFGGGDADNDRKTNIRNSHDISNTRRDRLTSSTSSRRQRDLEARKAESSDRSSIPTVQSVKRARKATKQTTRFESQGVHDALENDSEDDDEEQADDWNEEDFEELDDDEFGSLPSDSIENLQLGNEKASDWRSTIDQQSAFISAIYASPDTVPMLSLTDDTEDVSRKIEEVLRPEVVELPIHAKLRPDREKRLTPQVRTRKKRQRGVKGFVEEEYLETDKQARHRVAMEDRQKEWSLMKERWKRREYDYTDEVDVGNSIETMARQVLSQRELEQEKKKERERRRRLVLEHRRLEQQQRVKQESVDTGTDKMEHQVDETGTLKQREEYPLTQIADTNTCVEEEDGDDEASFDEQDQVLKRLLQNSASQEARRSDAAAATDDEKMENDLKQRERPFQDQLNYWESGRSIPPTKELEFCYGRKDAAVKYPTRRSPAPRNQAGEVVCDGRLYMTLRQFMMPKGGSKPHDSLVGVTNPRWYFPLPFNEASGTVRDKSRVRGEFLHHRQLRRMSARFLCGGIRNMRGNLKSRQRLIEDRLLRALHSMAPGRGDGFIGGRDWNKRHEYAFHHSHRKHLILHLTRQRALDIKCFIEHLWSDSSLVAGRLGLLHHNGFHSASHQLAGHSMDLHRVRLVSQKERNNMLKSRKLGKSIRYCELIDPYEYEEDRMRASRGTDEHDKPALGPPVDCVESLHAPTGDAVVADQQSMMSATKSSTTSIKDYFNVSYLSGLSVISALSCNYVHLEGTKPPIPSFPLDPIGIVFGPVDRHARYHHMAKLDETTLALTISTFMSRMVTAPSLHAKKNEEQSRIYYQLQSYLEQAPGLDLINVYKLLATTKSKLQDLPLVNPYHTLMTGCSVVANASVFHSEDSFDGEKNGIDPGGDDDSLYEDKDSDRENCDAHTEPGMNIIASRIHDHCEGHIQHNGLLRFPRLHLTFAIARLCRRLPAPVAEILSRSMDDGDNSSHHRTAVELMQVAMQFMENNHLIDDGGPTLDSEDGAVQVGLLEYWFYEAAEGFRRCMKLDFLALDYHLWYISALSACVILCSGNRIGSGARRYPSARTENGANSYFDPSETNDAPEHEVRRRLPKYEDVRAELAHGIRLLLDLAIHQTKQRLCGTKLHLAIASVFEWKQVVALLIGDATEGNHAGDGPWSDVRALHNYHATNWVLKDHSSCAREYAARLLDHPSKNNKLVVIAQDLEGDPSKLVHWRRIVEELGPIGKPIEGSQDCISHRSQCSECKRIRETLLVDHDTERARRNQNDWWASDRRSWWESCLLQMPQFEGRRSRIIADAIHKKMEASGPPVAAIANKAISFKSEHQSGEKNIVTIHDLSWLTDSRDAKDVRRKPPSDIERTKTFDHLLPQSFLEVLASSSSRDAVENASNREFDIPSLKGANAQALEVLCYKVLITCHMYSVNHPSIESAVWSIVMSCWEKKNYTFADCDEWTALSWLSSRGLNIPQILRDGCSTS